MANSIFAGFPSTEAIGDAMLAIDDPVNWVAVLRGITEGLPDIAALRVEDYDGLAVTVPQATPNEVYQWLEGAALDPRQREIAHEWLTFNREEAETIAYDIGWSVDIEPPKYAMQPRDREWLGRGTTFRLLEMKDRITPVLKRLVWQLSPGIYGSSLDKTDPPVDGSAVVDENELEVSASRRALQAKRDEMLAASKSDADGVNNSGDLVLDEVPIGSPGSKQITLPDGTSVSVPDYGVELDMPAVSRPGDEPAATLRSDEPAQRMPSDTSAPMESSEKKPFPWVTAVSVMSGLAATALAARSLFFGGSKRQ